MKWINVVLCCFVLCGCIREVQWKERIGDNGKTTQIPCCPYCERVVNHTSIVCQNPECKKFIRWSDKSFYYDGLDTMLAENTDTQTPENVLEDIAEPAQTDQEKIDQEIDEAHKDNAQLEQNKPENSQNKQPEETQKTPQEEGWEKDWGLGGSSEEEQEKTEEPKKENSRLGDWEDDWGFGDEGTTEDSDEDQKEQTKEDENQDDEDEDDFFGGDDF